jgi:hypothetical protein
MPNSSRGGMMPSISFSPTYHFSSATKEDVREHANIMRKDFEKLMREYEARNRRLSIG